MDQSLPDRTPALRLDARRVALLALLAVITLALLLQLGGGRATLTLLRDADWRLIALAAAIHYGGFALRGHRWQLLLAGLGHRLGYLYTTGVLLAGWFVSALLPARAGDAFRMVALRMPQGGQPTVPVAASLGRVVLERALDILAILLLSAGFSLVVLQARLPGWLWTVYGVTLAILVALGGALLLAPTLLTPLRGWSRHPLWHKALGFAAEVSASLRQLAGQPTRAGMVMAESLLIWLCDGLLLWLVVQSLGEWLPPAAAGFVALTVDIAAAVPLTPGGMGQVESAYAALLALISRDAGGAGLPIAAIILGTRAISYWSFLLVSGLITLGAGFGRLLTAPR
jgi:uncharacterized membrane protein YbhN (UPF0104 family)